MDYLDRRWTANAHFQDGFGNGGKCLAIDDTVAVRDAISTWLSGGGFGY